MRIYVVITKVRPLTVHLYKEGLARFSTDKYDTKSLKNVYSHLTNTSINKNSHNLNIMSGGGFGSGIKWTFQSLKALFKVSLKAILMDNS
jgi:tubulin polyglutamylase TTLL2